MNSGNFMSTATDERGVTSSFDYNTLTGVLNYTEDGNGSRTKYIYNTLNDRLTTVYNDKNKNGVKDSNEEANTYTYSKGMLSSIGHNGFNYTFTSDEFGNIISTKAANNTLATNEYAEYNGRLLKTTYGNSDYTENTYDSLGRLKYVKNNGLPSYEWNYNDNNQVTKYIDYENTKSGYTVTYDAEGNIIRTVTNGGMTILPSYDEDGYVTGSQYSFKDKTLTYTTTFDENNVMSSYTLPSAVVITPTYDDLGRLTSRIMKNGNTVLTNETYSYYPGQGGENAATSMIQSYGAYSYTYDKMCIRDSSRSVLLS